MSLFSKLTEKPWLVTDGPVVDDSMALPSAKKVGLKFFLAVVSSIFFLFIAAYIIRMDYGDWRPLIDPQVLWLNTLVLVASSIAFQIARNAAGRNEQRNTMLYLSVAGLLTLIFLGGQLWVWQHIHNNGYAIWANPANAFFYLLTGTHGLHLLGGLYVWLRTMVRIVGGFNAETVRLSVELCSVYWHFLLLVWLLVFGLLLAT